MVRERFVRCLVVCLPTLLVCACAPGANGTHAASATRVPGTCISRGSGWHRLTLPHVPGWAPENPSAEQAGQWIFAHHVTAYQRIFDDPTSTDGAGNRYPGEELCFIAQNAQVTRASFRSVERVLGVNVGIVQHRHELAPRGRIGQETRIFQLGLRFWEPPHPSFTQVAVAWRQGRVIGVAEAGTLQAATLRAQNLFARVQHG